MTLDEAFVEVVLDEEEEEVVVMVAVVEVEEEEEEEEENDCDCMNEAIDLSALSLWTWRNLCTHTRRGDSMSLSTQTCCVSLTASSVGSSNRFMTL